MIKWNYKLIISDVIFIKDNWYLNIMYNKWNVIIWYLKKNKLK